MRPCFIVAKASVLVVLMLFFFGCQTPVVKVSDVRLDRYSVQMKPGQTESLIATVVPADAIYESVSWSSSNASVVSVSNGRITAHQVGEANVVANVNGVASSPCHVVVEAILVTNVYLNRNSIDLVEGESFQLTASVRPLDATNPNVSWKSLDPSIATVSSDGSVLALSAGSTTVLCESVDGNAFESCLVTVTPPYIPVSGVSLDLTSLVLEVGNTYSLTASIEPANASNQSVVWTSSNPQVATVSSSGIVVAVSPGSAEIRVKTEDGGKEAVCTLTVSPVKVPVTDVSLDVSSISMTVGGEWGLSVTVLPENATDKSVTWSSDTPSVATVSPYGIVKALSPGSAKITVRTNDGGKTAVCSVSVSEASVPVTGVSLDKSSISMTVGEQQTLTAKVTPENATDKSVSWTSSNASVASVSSSGVVTAVASGSARITVTTTDGKKTASCTVTVRNAEVSVESVSLSPSSLSLYVGESGTLKASVYPSNATNKSLTWTSSNSSVASVSSSGVVSAKSVGNATITVKTVDGGKTASCTLYVSEKQPTTRVFGPVDFGKFPYMCDPVTLSITASDFSHLVLENLKMDFNDFLRTYSYDEKSAFVLSNGDYVAVGDKYGPVVYDLYTGADPFFSVDWDIVPQKIGYGRSQTVYVRFADKDGLNTILLALTAEVADPAKFDFGANKLANEWYDDVYGEIKNTARINVLVPSSNYGPLGGDVTDYTRDLTRFFVGYAPSVTLSEDSDPIYSAVDDALLETVLEYRFSSNQPYINGTRLFTSADGSQLLCGSSNSPSLIATLTPDGIVQYNYEPGDNPAKDLLNLWSYRETDQSRMLYANVTANTYYGECRIPGGQSSFHIRFVRPLDIDLRAQSVISETSVDGCNVEVAKFIYNITDWNNQRLIVTDASGNLVSNVIKSIDMYKYYQFKTLRIETGNALRNNWNTSDPNQWGKITVITPSAKLSVGYLDSNGVFSSVGSQVDSYGNEYYELDISSIGNLKNVVINYRNDQAFDETFSMKIPVSFGYAWGKLVSEFYINVQSGSISEPK